MLRFWVAPASGAKGRFERLRVRKGDYVWKSKWMKFFEKDCYGICRCGWVSKIEAGLVSHVAELLEFLEWLDFYWAGSAFCV